MVSPAMLTFEEIYRTGFFLIELDSSNSLIRTTWLSEVSHDELVDAALSLRDKLVEHKIEKLLANAQNLNALTSQSKEWLSTNYYNLLSSTGIKKMARILPTNLFRQLPLEAVITRADAISQLKYEARNFSSEAEGLQWLLD